MNKSMFPNEFFYNLALTVYAYGTRLEVANRKIYVFLKKTQSQYAGLLSSLLGEGVEKVCYKYICYSYHNKEKSSTYYNAVTIFVNFDTSIFRDIHATYLFDVPLAKEFWTGKEIRLYQNLDINELKAYLDSLNLEPYCEKIENDIYYCPDYYQNHQKKFNCNGVILLKNVTLAQAKFIYDVFKDPVYILERVEDFCRPDTKPIMPPIPDLRITSDLPEFIKLAVYKYSIPAFNDIVIYMNKNDKFVVVYPDKSFEEYTLKYPAQLRKIVIDILNTLLKKKYINAYCDEVNTLPTSVKYLDDLRRVERCHKWSS